MRYSLLRPLALAVHTRSVPLATIVRVFILVPGHQGGYRGEGVGGGEVRGGDFVPTIYDYVHFEYVRSHPGV